jgi:ketosteroid isomerase-like protein
VFARIGADWEDFRVEMGELVGSEDTVVAIGSYSGTYHATGKPMTVRVVHVWRLRDGKVVAFEQFTDTLKVAEAMEG